MFAAALIATGVAHGDRVAVWSPNSYHWPIAALGTHYAGGVLVPLNTRYTISEAAQIIERADARVIVTVGEFVGTNRLADVLGNPVSEGGPSSDRPGRSGLAALTRGPVARVPHARDRVGRRRCAG